MDGIQVIEEPWDEHELEILCRIDAIAERYKEEIRPLQEMLLNSRSLKMPRYIIMPTKG